MGSKIPRPHTDKFFVWGYLKPQVYIKKSQNLQHLKDLIVKEANSISKEFLEKSINSFRTRLQRCYDVNGGYVE